MTINVPDHFRQENTVFHYTSRNTAIQHILFEKRLRLAPRRSTIDPVEKLDPHISFHKISLGDDEKVSSSSYKLYSETKAIIRRVKQISFCRNKASNGAVKKYDYESMGFLKPRMWDQYGESYKGVCLVFSADQFNLKPDFKYGNVEYVEYKSLSPLNWFRIDENAMESTSADSYQESFRKSVEKFFFRKHKDYINEDEFRVINYSDTEYEYIDITKAIKGMIVSDVDITEFECAALKKYSKELNIPMYLISWKSNGVDLDNIIDHERLLKIISETMKS